MRKYILLALVPVLSLMFLIRNQEKTDLGSNDNKYKLVFSDEFKGRNGSQPDTTKWVRSERGPSTWNRWISRSSKVVYIKDGNLVLRAIPRSYDTSTPDTAKMLTGAIETYGKFDFQYGKVEVRMKTNVIAGNFPAVWLKPTDQNINGRFSYGEIDVVETNGYFNRSSHTIHTHQTHILKKAEPTSFEGDIDITRWHIYGMEWTPDIIRWSVDGKEVGVYRRSTKAEDIADGQWTFDRPFYLRLNQSVGPGGFPSRTPQTDKIYETRIDWIRVYQIK